LHLAHARPFYYTRRGREWENAQRARLRDKLIEIERWPGGWTSMVIRLDQDNAKLLMLPPRFPTEPPLEQTISLIDHKASAVTRWNFGRAYQNYKLGENAYGNLVKEF
jgi:hypothetical protein